MPKIRSYTVQKGGSLPASCASKRNHLHRVLLRAGMITAVLASYILISPPGVALSDAGAASVTKPNLIVLMMDDLDVHTLNTMNDLGYMPNFRKYIVNRGYNFRESFVTNSLCCPSRATFFTGLYTHNHGVLSTGRDIGSVTALKDNATIATWVKAAGYRTAHIGKYLNHYGSDAAAPGTSPLNPAYVPPGWDSWQALIDPTTYSMFGYRLNDNKVIRSYGNNTADYQTTVLSQRAADFVTSSRTNYPGTPLFLSVAPAAPHVELFTMIAPGQDGEQYADEWRWYIRPDPQDKIDKPQTYNYLMSSLPLIPAQKPSFNETSVTDKPLALLRPAMTADDQKMLTRQYRSRFAAMLAIDDMIGQIANALGPELARSLFVFTSDNGFMLGEHRMSQKSVAYEESIRVPLYVSMPGITSPRFIDALVANTDLAPTLAELANAPIPAVDGQSLGSFLKGQSPASWRKRFLVEHWTIGGTFGVPTFSGVRTGRTDQYPNRLFVQYLATEGNPAPLELYDLNTDPYQMDSQHAVAGRAAEISTLTTHVSLLKSCGGSTGALCSALEK